MVGAILVLNPALRRALLLSNLQRAHARHDEQDGKHRRELHRGLGRLDRIPGLREVEAREVLHRDEDPHLKSTASGLLTRTPLNPISNIPKTLKCTGTVKI